MPTTMPVPEMPIPQGGIVVPEMLPFIIISIPTTPTRIPEVPIPQTPIIHPTPTMPTAQRTYAARSYGGLIVPLMILDKLWRLRNHLISKKVHEKLHPLI